MERLTERWSDSVVKLKGCSNVYANVERKRAHIQNAIVRLAAYEDSGLMPDEISPVKHGKFMNYIHRNMYHTVLGQTCSICNEQILAVIDSEFRYCPMCGSKMDLEE